MKPQALNVLAFTEMVRAFTDDRFPDEDLRDEELDDLREIFSRLRDLTKLRVQNLISDLRTVDQDNPVFLPISLLRVLHGTGLREIAHTRILAWAFDPSSPHGFRRSLFSEILDSLRRRKGVSWPDGNYEIRRVIAEKPVGERRRIDIWVDGVVTPDGGETKKDWLVVIEAKISAGFSDQLPHYEQAAEYWKNEGPSRLEPMFVYLKDGSDVDGNLGTTKIWLPLAFSDLFSVIWREIRDQNHAPGFHLLRYYLRGLLSDVAGLQLPLTEGGSDYALIELCEALNGGDLALPEKEYS